MPFAIRQTNSGESSSVAASDGGDGGDWQVERQVCGTDGMTYLNECEMRLASCQKQQFIVIQSEGSCGTSLYSGRELAFTFAICCGPSVCLSIVCL